MTKGRSKRYLQRLRSPNESFESPDFKIPNIHDFGKIVQDNS